MHLVVKGSKVDYSLRLERSTALTLLKGNQRVSMFAPGLNDRNTMKESRPVMSEGRSRVSGASYQGKDERSVPVAIHSLYLVVDRVSVFNFEVTVSKPAIIGLETKLIGTREP